MIPNDFNWKNYLKFNRDLVLGLSITTRKYAIRHWLIYGYKEGRKYKQNSEYTNEPWTQFHSNKKYHQFTKTFGENYNLTYTDNLNQPSLIYFGMMPFKFPKFNNNIIIFIGTDFLQFLKKKYRTNINSLKTFFSKNFFISISSFIHAKLKPLVPSQNLRRVNLLGSSIKNIIRYAYYRQRGEHVYIYTNLSETYNISLLMDIYQRIRKVNPQIKFIIATHNLYYKINIRNINLFNYSSRNRFKPYKLSSVTKENMVNTYRKTFIGLRLTKHDGNSNTVCELGALGIKCIHNGDQPNCVPWTNIDNICKNILSEFKKRTEDYSEISRKTKEYILKSQALKWNNKDFWKKMPLEKIYIDNGINSDKIIVKEPIAYKYDFDLPEKNDNGEVSTKVKEYEINMKIKVGIVTSTNKLGKIDNIIRNYKQQIFFNKKLFLILNNNLINIENTKQILSHNNINYELIIIDEKYNLGYCLNKAIEEMMKQNFDIFSKFDDDDIYEKKYLLEQVYYLNKNQHHIIGKYNIPLFIPEHNQFYTIENFTKNNQFTKVCLGSTITFNINKINKKFNTKKIQGVCSIFLKEHINNGGKIYVTSFNNYIWVRYLDKSITYSKLNQITDVNLVYRLYSNIIHYKFIDVSHLLTTVIITMYNSSKTIEKCLLSILEQTHKNMEIIVADDCSDDNSVELVKSFIKNNKIIRLIKNNKNRGTYYCKNLALQSMTKSTKYIVFQDSDDYSHCERIRKQIEILYLTNGKLSVSLCKRYGVLRFACVSQVYDIEIFNKLGYFDNSRFGADSEYLERFLKLSNIEIECNYNYNEKSKYKGIFNNVKGTHYCIPHCLYFINNNDSTCLSNLYPLNSKKRIEYKKKYMKKIYNLKNLYYEFILT